MKRNPEMPPILCNLFWIRKTPAFLIRDPDPEFRRVLGAIHPKGVPYWLFPAYYPYTRKVVNDLLIVQPELEFTDEATKFVETQDELEKKMPKFEVDLGPDFSYVTPPYQHQIEATKFVSKVLRTAIFYDMGLGKTKAVIDAIRYTREKTLILAPSVGIHTWVKEFERHAGANAFRIRPMVGNKKAKLRTLEDPEQTDILIVNYDTAKLYYEQILEKFPYEFIVADESHYMRTHNSTRTKACIQLAAKASRRTILSGTPSLGDPRHLWGQLTFLGGHIAGLPFWDFQKRFCIIREKKLYKKKRPIQLVVGYRNLDILKWKTDPISLRKKKEECLDLPPRTVIDVEFDLGSEQKKIYNELVENLHTTISKHPISAASGGVLIQKLLQVLSGFILYGIPKEICDHCQHLQSCVTGNITPLTGGCHIYPVNTQGKSLAFTTNGKAEALNELLDSILAEESNKVIVWAHFIEELNLVEQLLKDRGLEYIRVDGSNSQKAPALSERFNSEPSIRVWLAQITTGVALTLTGASYMIYYGLNYDLGSYLQSLDRNYRIGQSKPVTVYRLTYAGSVLDYLYRSLECKEQVATTLADKLLCSTCPTMITCMAQGVQIYKKGCKFKNQVERVVTVPKSI
jgi:SNF2 family DNA or RNA helicase